jgi:hypothetical protein
MELVEGRLTESAVQRRWRLAMIAFARRVALAAEFEPAAHILNEIEEYVDRGIVPLDETQAIREFDSEHSIWMLPLPWTPMDTAKFFVQAASGGAQASQSQLFDAMYGQIVEYRLSDHELEWVSQTAIFKDIFGNPFRPVVFESAWRSESAVALARVMYESRNFSPMPILADALEEAGCDDGEVLSHCRQPEVHVRGCWVVDGLLGKN